MSIRKLFRTIAAVTLISVLFVTPVSAHGHHHRQAATTTPTTTVTDTSCPVCTVEGCTEEGRHVHDGHDYCGYDHADGYCDGTAPRSAQRPPKAYAADIMDVIVR